MCLVLVPFTAQLLLMLPLPELIMLLMAYVSAVGSFIHTHTHTPFFSTGLSHSSTSCCRYGNNTKHYKIRVGDYHSLVPEEYEEEYGVDQIVLHPSYRSDSNDYDLALARLSPGAVGHMQGECVPFSRHVLPACLPMRKERVLKQASNCHITGWGDTGEIVCVCGVC